MVEGVGVGRTGLHAVFDLRIWVDTPRTTRLARDWVRVEVGEMSPADYRSWLAEEDAHFAADRPWERADLVVDGLADLDEPAVRALLGLPGA